jgi:indolepyruvate ferredoxin oxidoreductase beta subunit
VDSVLSKITDRVFRVPGTAIAEELGNARAANVVLLGAFSALVDVPQSTWQEVIRTQVPAKYVELNRQAFQRGYGTVMANRGKQPLVS